MADFNPTICGNNHLHIPTASCDRTYFVGLNDVVIKQGTSFNLRTGVYAYDAEGNRLTYAVEPSSIDTSVVTTYAVVYTAEDGYSEVRNIAITELSDPVISGMSPINIMEGTTVDTMDGVSAIDGNGNPITVVCTEGDSITYDTAGTYTLHYTAVDAFGHTASGTRTVTVESYAITIQNEDGIDLETENGDVLIYE